MSLRSSRPGATRTRRSRNPSLAFELLHHSVVAEQGGEHRRSVRQNAKQRLGPRASQRRNLGERQERVEPVRRPHQRRHVARDEDRPRVGPRPQGREGFRVLAPIRGAVERIGGEAQTVERLPVVRRAHG